MNESVELKETCSRCGENDHELWQLPDRVVKYCPAYRKLTQGYTQAERAAALVAWVTGQ